MATLGVRGQRVKRRGRGAHSDSRKVAPAPQPVLASGVERFIVNSQQHDGVKMRSEHYASSPTHPDPPNITSAPAVAPATPELPDPGAMHADAPEVTTKEEHEIKRDVCPSICLSHWQTYALYREFRIWRGFCAAKTSL